MYGQKTNQKTLSGFIQIDIDNGTYDQFPKLKDRLQFLSDKLIKSHYCGNVELSESKLKTLEENEYL